MKHKNRAYSVLTLTLLSILLIFVSIKNKTKNDVIEELTDSLNQIQIEEELLRFKLNSTLQVREIKREVKFTYVFEKFQHYNKNIDTATVEKFIEVVEYFGLDTTKSFFDICISQICVESGAKQYYDDGSLVESSGNAVGISQIVPTTAFHYLRNIVGKNNIGIFADLGGTNYNFIFEYDRFGPVDSKAREEARVWTINETNNLILWGFIMKYTLHCNNNHMVNTLVAYNIGGGGLSNYIEEGNDTNKHEYVLMIMNSKSRLKRIMG